jgi:hypothetical protein
MKFQQKIIKYKKQETDELLIFEIRVAPKITNTRNYNPVDEFQYLNLIAIHLSS